MYIIPTFIHQLPLNPIRYRAKLQNGDGDRSYLDIVLMEMYSNIEYSERNKQ